MVHRVCLVDIGARFADDDTQFNLPICFGRSARNLNVIIRANYRRRPFVENNRLLRNWHAGLCGVVGVIQADADEFSDIANTRAKAQIILRRAFNQRQRFRIQRTQGFQASGSQSIACNIGNDTRQITYTASGIQKSGFFGTRRAITEKFHVLSFIPFRLCVPG